jgi:hypothetical protein
MHQNSFHRTQSVQLPNAYPGGFGGHGNFVEGSSSMYNGHGGQTGVGSEDQNMQYQNFFENQVAQYQQAYGRHMMMQNGLNSEQGVNPQHLAMLNQMAQMHQMKQMAPQLSSKMAPLEHNPKLGVYMLTGNNEDANRTDILFAQFNPK